MGTSSIYDGKMDKNPLLPDDFENEPVDQQEPQNFPPNTYPVKWKTVKTDISKFVSSGGRSGNVKHITRQYARASGGTQNLMRQSTSGIRAAHAIGNLLNGLRTDGIEKTFKSLGIEYSGKSVQEIFSNLINVIAPDSEKKEDIIAKKAAQESLIKIYQFLESNNMDLMVLNALSDALLNQAMCEYISSYVWLKMMNDLEFRFEKYMTSIPTALSLEQEFKQYISNTVEIEFRGQGALLSRDIHSAIDTIYENCFRVLEGTI